MGFRGLGFGVWIVGFKGLGSFRALGFKSLGVSGLNF